MNQVTIDFLNTELMRLGSNCYTYSVGTHYHVSFLSGIAPGEIRTNRLNDEWRTKDKLAAGLITDGLIPLADPHDDDKFDFSYPGIPKNHYMVAVFSMKPVNSRKINFHAMKIDADNPGETMISERNGWYMGHSGTEEDKELCKNNALIRQSSYCPRRFRTAMMMIDGDMDFFGFYAVPNTGLDVSMQKVIHDMHSLGGKYVDKLGTKFVDINLEFYDATKDFPIPNFKDQTSADAQLNLYGSAFKKFIEVYTKLNMAGAANIVAAEYQKTPLAKQDRARVYELLSPRHNLFQKIKCKFQKVY